MDAIASFFSHYSMHTKVMTTARGSSVQNWTPRTRRPGGRVPVQEGL